MIGYYFITDNALSRKGNVRDVKNALAAGVRYIQYRRKQASTSELYSEALKLRKICRGKSKFIVNDRLDIALAVDADGIHVGGNDLSVKVCRKIAGNKFIIGVTVNSLKQALKAQEDGADYIALAPVFPTLTKADAGTVCGLGLLRKIKQKIKIPLVAIGGIDLAKAAAVVAAGADGLCAISAVLTGKNVKAQIKKFQNLCERAGK